jgi:fatty acid amide hydrolase 2
MVLGIELKILEIRFTNLYNFKGTDIGGSIRMPAFYCGIYGHKPTSNLVNTRGCTLRTGTEKQTMVVAGPMTRYASDLKPIFEVLVGPKQALNLKLHDKVDLKKLRFFYCLDSGDMKCSKICSDLARTMHKVTKHFYDTTGREVEFIKLKGAEKSSKLWRYWMTQEPQYFPYLLGDSSDLNLFAEIAKKFIGQSDYTLASIYSLIDSLLPAEKADEMKRLTKELSEELENLLGDDGVLFYPSTAYPAPYHYAAFVQIYNFHYWSLFNSLHVPATQIPLGLNSEGLPLGIQVVAAKNQDRLCFAVAEEIERQVAGWTEPFRSLANSQ